MDEDTRDGSAPNWADARAAAVRFWSRFWRGLGGRLLAFTIAVIMAVEVLIFVPSAANFRTSWLMERVERAQAASLALEAAPDFMISDDLAMDLLATAEVEAVALKRGGQRELILMGPAADRPPTLVDLRTPSTLRAIGDLVMSFGAPEDRRLRVVATPRLPDGEFIEIIVREAPLRADLWEFSKRIFWLSLVISVLSGALVYAALSFVFVRPMRRLAAAMTRFRAAPHDASRVIYPSGRRDEIGQAEQELEALQTEVRRALNQRERLAALGEAVAKINHDLRNILTAAQLVSDRLAMSQDPTVRQQAERLVRATDRGVRLAEDVLAFGRADEPAPALSTVVLRPLVEDAFADAVAVSDTPTGLDMTLDERCAVIADPEHVHRVFLNLMRNAIQAIAAQDDRATPGVLTVSARDEGADVVICVADDGPGVPERAREALFNAFTGSTRKGGTGLGLSIARELARSMGGDVTLEATGAEGATFAVRLPRAGN